MSGITLLVTGFLKQMLARAAASVPALPAREKVQPPTGGLPRFHVFVTNHFSNFKGAGKLLLQSNNSSVRARQAVWRQW